MKSSPDYICRRVMGFIKGQSLVSDGDRLLLSLSAGKDSMALFNIFLFLRDELKIDFDVFHLNHMMRGSESEEDEEFVKKTVMDMGIRIFIRRFDFKRIKSKGLSFEEFAREKRYEFLNEIAGDTECSKIVTAHSRDDNIETILMRIFSGTGVHGLKGIPPVRGNIIRPLLVLSTGDIYNYLKKMKISYREDSSNRDIIYKRNYLRNVLLPGIRQRFQNADESISSLCEISRGYEGMIDSLLQKCYEELYWTKNGDIHIQMDRFNDDVFRYVLSKAIRERGDSRISYGMINEICRKCLVNRSHLTLFENKDLIVRKTLLNNKRFVIISKNRFIEEPVPGKWEYSVGVPLKNEVISLKEINIKIGIEIIDYDFFLNNFKKNRYIFLAICDNIEYIILRNRRDGDRIKLENGTKKIKDLLINLQIENNKKNLLPHVVVDSKIAAIMPGFMFGMNNRVSPDFWVHEDSKKILAIYRVEN